MYDLKKLAARDLDAALDKAQAYRDLNQPEEAESICLDVLDIAPRNQSALRILGLSITDQFNGRAVGLFERALDAFARLEDVYERVYYTGIAWERSGKAHLERSEGHSALTSLENALASFEEAERLGPPQSPDPILRWNRCVRLLTSHPLLQAAIRAPHQQQPGLGD
jgi:tetratricopeptide (TPR) repeat protein